MTVKKTDDKLKTIKLFQGRVFSMSILDQFFTLENLNIEAKKMYLLFTVSRKKEQGVIAKIEKRKEGRRNQ